MTSLALFITRALKEELHHTLEEWSEGELHKVITSAIADTQDAEDRAVDALIAMALHPRSAEITARVGAILDAQPLCQRCGKPESEHGTVAKWCTCDDWDLYTFTPADPTKEKP